MIGMRVIGIGAAALVSLSTAAASTPQMWIYGELNYNCYGGDLGPWSFRIDWLGATQVTGLDPGDIDGIGVDIWWEVPLGDEDPAGYGDDFDYRNHTTAAMIISGEWGESHNTKPTYAVAEFGHSASVPSLDWYPWAVVGTQDSDPVCGAT